MGVLTHSFFFFLTFAYLFNAATTYPQLGIKRTSLGESHFALDRNLLKRQERGADLGADCEGDTACVTTPSGCECHFADESRVNIRDETYEEDAPPEEPNNEPPPPPQNDPVDPPGKLRCEPTPVSKPKDAHEHKVRLAVNHFCDNFASTLHHDLPITKTLFVRYIPVGWWSSNHVIKWNEGDESEDDVYIIKLERVEKCTTNAELNLARPVGNYECAGILHSAWKQCNNLGRGGSLVAGCLTYSIVTKF